MTDVRTSKNLQDFPILTDGRVYIYIMENAADKIKIGKTANIFARYQSLCGSNGQGIEITHVFVSPATWLHTIETIMHDKFEKYRIPNTEWFCDESDSGALTFDAIVQELNALFQEDDYTFCNTVRQQYRYLLNPSVAA